jgi:hypothetical protein
MQHDAQPQESEQHEVIEKQVGYHRNVPLTGGERAVLYLIFGSGITLTVQGHDHMQHVDNVGSRHLSSR